jgi:hypothetical protein
VPQGGVLGNLAFVLPVTSIVVSFKEHTARLALGIGATMAGIFSFFTHDDVIARERSFFGVHRVQTAEQQSMRVLLHGTTVHGAQYADPAKRRTHLLYYHRAGPFGQLFDAYAGLPQTQHAALVGLGTGALACYRQPGQDWTFYEIDPVVLSLARDSGLFHYLGDCAPDAPIVLGDARLSLRTAPAHRFGLILVDAFSSDAIPIHLLTREALAGYLGTLAPNGILAVHISNRYLDLAPVLAGIARDAGLAGRHQFYRPAARLAQGRQSIPAEMVVLAREESTLAPLDVSGTWRPIGSIPPANTWTDDYSNIVGAIR